MKEKGVGQEERRRRTLGERAKGKEKRKKERKGEGGKRKYLKVRFI